MADGRTRVYITVDVECAEERILGDTKSPAMGHDLRIWGRFVNQREPSASSSSCASSRRTASADVLRRGHRLVQLRDGWADERVPGAPQPRPRRAAARAPRAAARGLGTPGASPASPTTSPTTWSRSRRGSSRGARPARARGRPGERAARLPRRHFRREQRHLAGDEAGGLVLSSNYNPCYFSKNCKMQYPGRGSASSRRPSRGCTSCRSRTSSSPRSASGTFRSRR